MTAALTPLTILAYFAISLATCALGIILGRMVIAAHRFLSSFHCASKTARRRRIMRCR